ncbi:PLD nuclease N-terminal domain-containing protein [Angustibacter sp. McL0619]|uniref:PLD nuclease N-terminal domain-containing protein n=1 Tax=Angustibacter sp. McL0619 TaxID=3415676 RepID=UPI003CFB5E83
MAGRKKWSDLTREQRTAVVVAGAVELVLTSIALRDLARRDADEVRGPKLLWRASFAVQPFGPVAYLLLGRRAT